MGDSGGGCDGVVMREGGGVSGSRDYNGLKLIKTKNTTYTYNGPHPKNLKKL